MLSVLAWNSVPHHSLAGPSVHTGQQTTLLGTGADQNLPKRGERPWNLGAEVLLDALLLAKSEHLVHSESNVAAFALYMNPGIHSHYIGEQEVLLYRHGAQIQLQVQSVRIKVMCDMHIKMAVEWAETLAYSLGVVGNMIVRNCNQLDLFVSAVSLNLTRFTTALRIGQAHMRVFRLEMDEELSKATDEIGSAFVTSVLEAATVCPPYMLD